MPHRFGGLELPVEAAANSRVEATGDPFLDVLVSYLKAVLNAKAGEAWRSIAPGSPNPVIATGTHNPGKEAFRGNALPGLFAWRADSSSRKAKLGSLDVAVTNVVVAWVPPRTQQETLRIRHPFRNAIEKVIRYALVKGRDPSWVIDGDNYFEPRVYGSVFLHHAQITKLDLGSFQRQDFVVEFERGKSDSFDALLTTLEVTEVLEVGDDSFDPLDHIEGSIYPSADTSVLNLYHFEPALITVQPDSGSTAGGTPMRLTGRQFAEGVSVAMGGAACTDVVFVDEATLTAVAPPHAAGVVDVRVTLPSGAVAMQSSAFTYA